MGKRQKNSGDRNKKKKRRNLAENYQGSSWQNYYIGEKKGGTKGKEKKDGMRIGTNGKIPRDEES